MFSFVTRLFKKKSKSEEAVGTETVVDASGSTPYSMDFTGADRVRVSARDCARENVDAIVHSIIRPEEIADITKRLAELPKEGEGEIEVTPCQEHTITAYKAGVAFAEVVFYEHHLKLEDGMRIINNEKMLEKQAELFAIIKVDLHHDS